MESISSAGLLRDILREAVRKLGFLQKGEAACCGITVGQCHALVEIGRSGALSLNEVADLLNLDKSTVSRTVDNLVNQGLLTRKNDAEDRRYIQIVLTEKGRLLFEQINGCMKTYFTAVISAIQPENREMVAKALPYLLQAFRDAPMYQEWGCTAAKQEIKASPDSY